MQSSVTDSQITFNSIWKNAYSWKLILLQSFYCVKWNMLLTIVVYLIIDTLWLYYPNAWILIHTIILYYSNSFSPYLAFCWSVKQCVSIYEEMVFLISPAFNLDLHIHHMKNGCHWQGIFIENNGQASAFRSWTIEVCFKR